MYPEKLIVYFLALAVINFLTLCMHEANTLARLRLGLCAGSTGPLIFTMGVATSTEKTHLRRNLHQKYGIFSIPILKV